MDDDQFGDEVEDLVETLALEQIEVNLFRGLASGRDGPRIFGGHVIAQSLMAAYATVTDSVCHSLHCYFLRPGDPKIPILYEVDRARDGKSFASRRVTAIQHGQQIFNFAASFQSPEVGLEHQLPMPDVPGPETLEDDITRLSRLFGEAPPPAIRRVLGRSSVQQRSVHPLIPGEKAPPINYVWMRARAPIGDDPRLHQAILAYTSDMGLLTVATRPHGLSWRTDGLQMASLDHAIWFHRPLNFNAWHLYAQDSPSASSARGFTRGEVFSESGVLVASTAQEGLIRLHDPD